MKFYQPAIVEKLLRLFNPKVVDSEPPEVAPTVQPTIAMDFPSNLLGHYNGITSVASSTVYSVPTGRKLFLTRILVGYSKTAACDVAGGAYRVQAYLEGVSGQKDIIAVPICLGNVQDLIVVEDFKPGEIVIRGGTNITVSAHTYTAGASARLVQLHGYLT